MTALETLRAAVKTRLDAQVAAASLTLTVIETNGVDADGQSVAWFGAAEAALNAAGIVCLVVPGEVTADGLGETSTTLNLVLEENVGQNRSAAAGSGHGAIHWCERLWGWLSGCTVHEAWSPLVVTGIVPAQTGPEVDAYALTLTTHTLLTPI